MATTSAFTKADLAASVAQRMRVLQDLSDQFADEADVLAIDRATEMRVDLALLTLLQARLLPTLGDDASVMLPAIDGKPSWGGACDIAWDDVTVDAIASTIRAAYPARRARHTFSGSSLREHVVLRANEIRAEAAILAGGPESVVLSRMYAEQADALTEAAALLKSAPWDAANYELPALLGGADPHVDWSAVGARDIDIALNRVHPRFGRYTSGGSGSRHGFTGAVVTDGDDGAASNDGTTFADFVAARAEQRAAHAQRIVDARVALAKAIEEVKAEHVRASQAVLDDETVPRRDRQSFLRWHEKQAENDADTLRDEFAKRYPTTSRAPWDRLVGPWREQRQDHADWRHVAEVRYEDMLQGRGSAPDPILLAIPGVRRKRVAGAFSYEVARQGVVKRELLRVFPESGEILLRTRDHAAIEAAVLAAHRQFGPPMRFSGKPEFVAACKEVAVRHGLEVAADVVRGDSASAGAPAHGHGVAATPGGAATAPSASPADAKASAGTPEFNPSDQFPQAVAALEELYPDDALMPPVKPGSGQPVAGTIVHTERLDADFTAVFVRNAAAGVIATFALRGDQEDFPLDADAKLTPSATGWAADVGASSAPTSAQQATIEPELAHGARGR